MRAYHSRTRARTEPIRNLIPWMFVALWTALALTWGLASGATTTGKTTAATDTTSDGGFSVRVKEEGSSASRAAVRQAVEEAKEAARRMRAQARASGVPEPPEPPDVPDKFDFDSSDNNVVRFGEDITIPESKVVEGDVVAIGGSVTVLGRVKGDCVSIGGAVNIKGKGVVEGDAVSMGGGVTTSDSGTVAGSNVSLGSGSWGSGERFWPMVGLFGAVGTGIWLFTAFVKLLLTLFFAWLALLLARERMVHAVEVMTQRFGKSFLWGLIGWAAMVIAIPTGIVLLVLVGVIAIAILAITIIGIPVAILLVIALVLGIIGICVAAMVAIFVGFLNGAMFLGQRILGKNPVATGKPIVAIAVGLALIFVLNLAGHLLQLIGLLVFHPIAIALGIAAGALCAIVTTSGFGAMVLTRFAPGPLGPGAVGSQWWPSSGATPPPAAPPPAAAPPTAAPPAGGSSDAP
jgi:hypothetical protein